VGVDIFAAAVFRVAVQQMFDAVKQIAPPGPINGRLDGFAVVHEQFDQSRQIIGMPVAVDITFGETDITRTQGGIADIPVFSVMVTAAIC